MSAASSIDVTCIRDEDVLRKMWQDTEDFGRKKEIRAHMYKLREARLRDFYNSGEISNEIQKSTKTTENTNSKSNRMTTHADNLADHSFLSLKSKEIRDSESPTRDVSYKISEKQNVDQGWTVTSGAQRSEDGKTHTSTHLATTSGTQIIEGGKVDYDAKAQHKSSIFQDGDDKNYVRAVGDSSSSAIHQEAVGGDENSSFKATATKTSSSSKYVSESKSSSGDVDLRPALLPASSNVEQVNTSSSNVSTRVFTTDAPKDVKNHPSYIEGKTKVIQETNTLPDGTIVTTTKYETRKGNSIQTTTHKKYSKRASSASEQKISSSSSSQVQSSSSKSVKDSRNSTITSSNNNQNAIEYVCEPRTDVDVNVKVTRGNVDHKHQDTSATISKSEQVSSQHISDVSQESHYNQNVQNRSTNSVVTDKFVDQDRQKIIDIAPVNQEYRTSTRKIISYNDAPRDTTDDVNNYSTTSSSTTIVKNQNENRKVVSDQFITNQNQDIRENRKVVSDQFITNQNQDIRENRRVVNDQFITNQNQDIRENRRVVNDQFITNQNQDIRENRRVVNDQFITNQSQDIRENRNVVSDQFITTERKHEQDTTRITDSRQKPEGPERRPILPSQDATETITTERYVTQTRNDINEQRSIPEKVSPERIPQQTYPKQEKTPQQIPQQPYQKPEKTPQEIYQAPTTKPKATPEPYEHPDRRQPIKPGKSELDQKPHPTEGQYDTTYRTDYTNKKISVEVSASHDAFARSLRAVTPERITRPSSTPKSSSPSLRSSVSPDKNRYPSRSGSPRKSEKFSSSETITYSSSPDRRSPTKSPERNTDTYNRRRTDNSTITTTSKTNTYNTDTVTRNNKIVNGIVADKRTHKPRSPSPSGTTTSDFEYVRNIHDVVTDLDEDVSVTRRPNNEFYSKDTRPTTLEITTTKKTRKVTDRSPTSPLTDIVSARKSPTKEVPKKSNLKSPTKDVVSPQSQKPTKALPEDRPLKRTDTYEERVKQILGITNVTSERRRSSLERRNSLKRSSFSKDSAKSPSSPKLFSPTKPKTDEYTQIRKSPERKSPTKEVSKFTKSPDRSPIKEKSKISEFPSQVRRSPEKQPAEKYPERKSPTKESPKIAEFPSQIRRSPEKEPLSRYPEKKSPTKEGPKIAEFPSQIRRSPERQPMQKYPERHSPTKEGPKIAEFPSQIRKSPEKQPLEKYPEKKSPIKERPVKSEFPAQTRKSPTKDLPYERRESPDRNIISLSDLPSQTGTVPQERIETHDTRKTVSISQLNEPTRKSQERDIPLYHQDVSRRVSEFPSQIRKSPECEPLEPYPERKYPEKKTPSLNEFPSQLRKSPEREPLEPYPERRLPEKKTPSVNEYPSQIRKTRERETLEPYPERRSPEKNILTVNEYPSQTRKSPERETLEPYPERKSPEKKASSLNEFPSQIRKSPEREPLQPYPEKKIPEKRAPGINEFPSQIRKSPERETLEPHPERKTLEKKIPTVNEFPSQIRKSPEREPLEPYPERKSPEKMIPSVNEFPPQIRKPTDRQPLEPYPEKKVDEKKGPLVSEFPSQGRKSPKRDSLGPYPGKPLTKTTPKKRKPTDRSPESDESSTTDEEVEIEEPITQTTYVDLENKVPISEPLVTKKFIDQLCREEEIQRTDVRKKSSQEILEEEILISDDVIKPKSTVKKDKPEKVTKKVVDTEFIKKEKEHLRTTTNISKKIVPKEETPIKKRVEKTPSKKTVIETTTSTTRTIKKEVPKAVPKPQISKHEPSTYKTEKSKFIGETEYKTAYSDITTTRKDTPVAKKPQRPAQKNTLWNIENLDKVKTDTSVHIRTHRIDDAVVKKTQTSVRPKVSGEAPKSRPSTEQPTKKREPVQKPHENKPKYTTTIKKTITTETKPRPSKTPEPTTTKKHVVTATITVSPKSKTPTRPVGKAVSPSVTTAVTKKVTQVKTDLIKPKLQNGHISSDTEGESIVDSIEDLTSNITTEKRRQITRTSSDQVLKTPHKAPVRGLSKPELGSPIHPDETHSKISRKPDKKCITTKTVIINNKDTDVREIIVDLQRSKSSREPTPDRLCPHPVTSDEEGDAPRYPDQISEPEDGSLRRRPKKLHDIPIFEGEDTEHFTRIIEIEDTKKISEVDKVEETDESLLSVNKKISKFLDTADKLTQEPIKPRAPKVDRPTLIVTEDLKTDECLLSVSDKVSKFINTAEKLVTPQTVPERPKSPKCKNYFETTELPTTKPKVPTPKIERPDFTQLNKTIREDESSLSVSDKVSKFISAAEKLTTSSKNVSLSKIDIKPKSERQPSPRPGQERQPSPRPAKKAPSKAPTEECVQIEREEQMFTRRPSPDRVSPDRRSPSPKTGERTPTRRPSNQYTSVVKTDTTETKYSTRDSSPKLQDTTPKSTRRPSQDESKTVLSTTSRLRSTESIKKAKALFENITKEQDIVRQKDILIRPSVFDGRKPNVVDTTTKITTTSDNLKSTRLIMEKIKPKSKSPDKSPDTSRSGSPKRYEITRFRSTSPEPVPPLVTTKPKDREPSPSPEHLIYEGDVPHYMKPLDRTLRPNSPHRDSIDQAKASQPKVPEQEATRPTKFGVTLRRTDSGRAVTTFTDVTIERRKSSITLEKRITEEEIEEIFDLEVLEELLEKVVGYELRRKIRTQIRLVKKLISEHTLETYVAKRKTIPREAITRRGSSPFKTSKPSEATPKTPAIKKETEHQAKYVRKPSPQRTVVDNNLFQHTDIVNKSSEIRKTSEYQSSYSTHTERRTSSDYSKTTTSKSSSPTREKSPGKTITRTSPERKTTRTTETTPTSKTTTVKTTETVPGGLRTTTTKTTDSKSFTTLKKTTPVSKTVIVDDQPEWVKRSNLRKTTETTAPTNKKVTSSSTTTTSCSTKKTSVRSSSPLKESKPTDIITSSYGVGPTDENGSPLFGLKALRAQNRSEQTSKVQGTMVTSEYYSENGEEPVGHISVTKYSTDPKDLEKDGKISKNQGVTSVTTTQKFGYKDTPSLRSLSDKKKEICDTRESSETTTKTTKLNRRGSVKAISQKFIENTVESLKNERQTSYPKAGLILRTSSFKDSSGSGSDDNRETSPAERESKSTVTVRTSRISGGETFLTNKSRVSGVQDVITRMKAEDYQEGDNDDDIAARGLLNKFIGSQVILSGLESHHGTTHTTTSSSPSSTLRRSTKITTTITEGGKPTTSTRIFQRPVTEEELSTVWDEQTLRLLLEQSTDYEERRTIRARLRQVMAEQEACTELVDKASEEDQHQTSTGQIDEKIETTKETTRKGDAMTTKVTTKVTTQQVAKAKPLSPFAKFRQLDKQNSLNKSTPPSTPGTPRTPGGTPLFKFTDPALNQSASTIKERLLHWCRMKTKEYENIQLDNFSTSWADGLAFCALIHHFLPDAFDYHTLTPKDRRHNFELAFKVADEKADIAPLLDVEDMIETRRPDWKCVFTYVQSIYRRFKDED